VCLTGKRGVVGFGGEGQKGGKRFRGNLYEAHRAEGRRGK